MNLIKYIFLAAALAVSAFAQAATLGQPVTLTASADGTPPFTYTWLKGSTVLTGQTGAVITLASVTLADAGVYTVKIGNQWDKGQPAVATATLTVEGLPPTNPKLTIGQKIVAWLKSVFSKFG